MRHQQLVVTVTSPEVQIAFSTMMSDLDALLNYDPPSEKLDALGDSMACYIKALINATEKTVRSGGYPDSTKGRKLIVFKGRKVLAESKPSDPSSAA